MFTTDVLSFRQLEINNRTGLYDKKHRICFASLRCQESYNKLLESPCTMYVKQMSERSADHHNI